MYRIGVDARLLCDRGTGIGRYNLEVLSRLVSFGHQWVLYANRPLTEGNWQFENVKTAIDPFPGDISRQIWAQSILPYRANNDRLDLFWSPAHRLPNFLSAKIARVVTIHDLVWKHAGETMRPSRRLLESILMPQAVNKADRIITDSKHTEKDLLEAYPAAKGKTRTVYLGKPEQKKSSLTVAPGGFNLSDIPENYILFVGTMEPRKNLERLFKAYARLPSPVQDMASLVIIGGKGWGGIDASSLAKENGIAKNVRVIGYVHNDLLHYLYSKALFLAMPSLHEGFGLPLLEAMSVGVPVLTSNCSSMPEVAGDAGLLVNPFDIAAISKGMQNLLENEALRKDLAQKSLRQADKFSWEKTARQTLDVFMETLSARREKLKGSLPA